MMKKGRKYIEKMVGRVGFEPTTIGLKVQNGKNNDLYINELPGRPMPTFAALCITMHNCSTQNSRRD
jgi:hypothetical protein